MRRVPASSIRSINLPVPPELIFNPDLDAAVDRLFDEVDRSRSRKRARAAASNEAIKGLVLVAGACRSGEDCPVCLQNFCTADETLRAMPCSHAFHYGCISQWLRRNASCPLCRHQLLPDEDEDAEEHQNQRRRTTT
ncbi:hypothetical protein HU200_049993 [Digitaria exilis]|uniref:RING-type domain-containing protein n=1 Tax=Digitaria exilis TaxID=1010633 RepID=A0A835E691_9POAL|nr:hypothetical protein HU200_049993 [Digitaria exilis]CAB3488912.1 unnamed protein product [Digitaria exilis]